MEEKTIVEGKSSFKLSSRFLLIGGSIFILGILCYALNVNGVRYSKLWTIWQRYTFREVIRFQGGSGFVSALIDIGFVAALLGFFIWLCIKDNCITVTNKRVYGVTKWRKRVDLPLNQVSAVATSWLKGIAVGTSSGKIVFKAIENNIEVHKELTRLLATKQDASVVQAVKVENSNNIDDLKKIKDLLDSGIITQEEFDAKKKQLLGL